MFSATAHQVVKSLGKDSLIPVQSIDVSDNIKPLAILLTERRRRFFWRRTRYLTTEFCLDDILDEALCKDGANKDEIVRSRELAKFDFETNFSLSGKLGIDLQKEFLDFELDASDNATVKSELGELRKEEVNLPAFLSLTKERRINLQHQLVAPLTNDSTRSLCLVTGVVHLAATATLTGQIKESGSESGSCMGSTETGEVSKSKVKKLEVPAGTALAYTVRELLVSTVDGQFRVVLDTSCHGGFVFSLDADVDDVDGPSSDSLVKASFLHGILSSEIPKDDLRASLLEILKVPKAIGPLDDLFHEAAVFLETKILKTTLLSILQERIYSLEANLLPFLSLAGFTLQEADVVVYPTSSSELFEACELLITLLNGLDDDQLSIISACIEETGISQDILCLLRPVWDTDTREVEMPSDSCLLQTDTGKKLSQAFGFEVTEFLLSLSEDNVRDVQALYLIIFLVVGSSDTQQQ
ncbi:gasdermin-E-like isoform X2 [Pomacea canaliculata]|uniref:gasdermin-E-like isoform X2 n=1 Tax=Pomacea canaliculata TaxID=400727 RepID=UPI000D72B447|nr:gasdermin-E-like isoform X2 [Pomacea canaliculata]